jgi:hypothetical protein
MIYLTTLSDEGTDQKFKEYHSKNPDVYKQFVRITREAHNKGKETLSIWLVANVVRWYVYMNTTDPNSEFKISNDYLSRYARLIMDQELDLQGIFKTKRLKDELYY